MEYHYHIKPAAIHAIRQFYRNVYKKYRHTYSYQNQLSNTNQVIDDIYLIERSLLRRRPTIESWQKMGWHMAKGQKWYYAYSIQDDTIVIEDARHEQNMY